MVPNDRRFTNATVDHILLVKELLVAPNIEAHDLVVRGTASIQTIAALDSLQTLKINSLETNTSITSKLFVTDFSDQLVLGTGNTIIVNAPTPSSSHIYTIPDVGTNAEFVMTEGAQTIQGVKTFTDTPIFLGDFSFTRLTLSALTDQLTLGTNQTITLNAPTPTVSHIYTLPDVSVDSDFVMTEGHQLIMGVKAFVNMAIFISGFATASLSVSSVTNQITMGVGNKITINAPTPIADHIYTMPDVGADASFVMTEGAQTLNGVKTFSATAVFLAGFTVASLTLSAVSNQLILGTGQTITINAPTPVASRIYTVPDVSANASFMMTEGAQTVNGTKTFSSAIVDTALTNQLILGAATTITLNAPAPAVSRIYSFPDVGANASFVMTVGTQTIGGAKTFSLQIVDTAVTNQLVLGTGTTITVNAPSPAASRVYTMSDVMANASFVMTEGAQIINGIKTFTSIPIFPALSLTNITLTDVTNQIALGTGNLITLNAPTPAVSRIYTIPDVLANADFVMTQGVQLINGLKTFSLSIQDTALTNQLILGNVTTITLTAPAPAASRTYTFPDVLTHASFVMTEGAQTINALKTFSNAITDTALTNQLILGTGTTITLNAPAPVANRIYSFVDVGANANFVMTEGSQTINNTKTFTSAIVAAPLINQLILGAVTTITVNAPAPAASRVYTMPDVLVNAHFVLTEGTQTINGSKTFAVAIRDSALTNQLILGNVTTITLNAPAPAASRVYTMPDVLANANFIMSEGAQTINGVKTFTSAPVFPALSLTNILLTNVTNQIAMGTGNLITVNAPTPAASRTYTMPDVLADASFVMTQGNQTIAANKTFSGNILLATTGGTPANLNFYSETTQTPFALTGPFSVSPQNTTVRYVRIGINVTMIFTGFTVAPGGVASAIVSTTLIPAEYRPVETFREFTSVRNNGDDSVGNMEVNTSGVLTFWRVQNFNATQVTLQNGGASVGVISFAKSWRV